MPAVDVTLNPGSGGANVKTFQQSAGDVMPLSGLGVSPDGIQDMAPVTGLNPLPVVLVDAATNSPTGLTSLLEEQNELLKQIIVCLQLGFDINLDQDNNGAF